MAVVVSDTSPYACERRRDPSRAVQGHGGASVTKVAYLIGVSGSGKGYIACRLEDDVQVIKADRLRDKAEHRLSIHYSHLPDEWTRCDNLLRRGNAAREFSAILAALRLPLSRDPPLLAEGISLGHDRWREALRTALVCQGITITDERVFWIDCNPELVWKYRQERGRKGQRNETVEEVREHRDYYHERVSHHLICRYEDTLEAIRAIRGFLLA